MGSAWMECAWAAPLAPRRDVEPVVFEGVRLTAWAGVRDLRQIGLFRFDASTGQFTPIPFQIDKRREINLKYNINDTSTPGGTANVCEFGYFRELGLSPGSPEDRFASDTLAGTDEIVFMIFDAGGDQAPRSTWHPSADVDLERYEISITDPLTGANRWVYAFRWNSGTPERSSKSYVSWASDPSSPACTTYGGANPCGTAKGVRGSTGVPTSAKIQEVHFQKNWVTDRYRVDSGGGWLPNLIQRIEYKTGQETEDTWSTRGSPRLLGIHDETSDNEKPIRRARGVQGAQSGRHTTKYEFVYPTMFVTRVTLRVHPLASPIQVRTRHTLPILQPTVKPALWTETGYGKPPGHPTDPQAERDIIDGAGPADETVDPSKARYGDWSEIATTDHGTYAHFIRDLRAIPAGSFAYTYQDWLNTAKIGYFGERWSDVGNTQDGAFPEDYSPCPGCAINDGGCGSNPEGSHLNFARFEQVWFPDATRANPLDSTKIVSGELRAILNTPLTLATRKQHRDYVDPPPLVPCVPGLNTPSTGDGVVDLSLNTSGCSAETSGFRLYRAEGAGSFRLLRDLGTGSSLRDWNVSVGSIYRYAVTSYNEVNTESALSAPVELTVTDTTAPAVPTGLDVEPADGRLILTWSGSSDRDISGYDVWMSGPGSGYEVVGSGIPAGGSAVWAQIGLANGSTYCFKVSAEDLRGNASAPSAEACGVPGTP